MNELYNDNCLSVLQNFIENNKKVDCIITSPPYNMCLTVNKGKYVSRWKNKKNNLHFSNKYESYKDDLSMNDYFEFQNEFINKSLQISDLLFYNIQLVTGNKVALFNIFGKYANKIKEVIIWDKMNSQPAIQKGALNSQYEFIIVFQNSKPYNRNFEKSNFERGTINNIWRIKKERNPYIKAGFPKELIRKILINFTNKNDTIMDPFMGSGTTGVVCKELERHFIGVEIDTHYFEIAKQRIHNSYNQLFV